MLCIHSIKGPVCRRYWSRPAQSSGNLAVVSRRQMGEEGRQVDNLTSPPPMEKKKLVESDKRQASALRCSVLHALWARSQGWHPSPTLSALHPPRSWLLPCKAENGPHMQAFPGEWENRVEGV